MSKYWPYDETLFEAIDATQGSFRITTPWLITTIEVSPQSHECEALLDISKNRETPNPKNMLTISKILSQLSKYPIAYELPRIGKDFGKDAHKIQNPINTDTPPQLAKSLNISQPGELPAEWMWDHSAIIDFSSCTGDDKNKLCDPLCLLTVARRFHYLDCADNKIGSLYKKIETLSDAKDRRAAAAIVVRQNHYVTVKCQQALQPSLQTAQSQGPLIQEFMEEEKGHDAILSKGLEAMGLKAQDVPTTLAVQNLMSAFEAAARTNFLGFCLCLDFFEKPEFTKTDSLSEVLEKLGETTAARALQAHKNINDHGEHEGFSTKLLSVMMPAAPEYVHQATKIAELVSFYISQVPYDLNQMIFND